MYRYSGETQAFFLVLVSSHLVSGACQCYFDALYPYTHSSRMYAYLFCFDSIVEHWRRPGVLLSLNSVVLAMPCG